MNLRSIFKAFPPPKFLKPGHIGVSFSDSSIRAISFKASANPDLKGFAVPLEKGAISSGGIQNAAEISKKLALVKEKFDTPFVFFTVPDEIAYVFSAEIPFSKGGNLKESVAFIMEENVPLPLSEVIFDFVPTKISPGQAETTVSVVVAALVKKETEKYAEAFFKAGLEPVGCIHESQAIAEAVIPKKFDSSSCVIQARENRIGIHLAKKNVIHFSTIRTAGSGDYKKEFLDEYDKFLDYCMKYDGENLFKSVFVCGEFEYARKIVEAVMDSKTPVKDVKLSNVWSNVFEIDKHLPEIPYEESLGFAGPVGAVLTDII